MRIFRYISVAMLSAIVGLLAFYLTALLSGEPWRPAWQKDGIVGVILWAYERGSVLTIVALSGLALGCGWSLRSGGLVAAVSLALFYPCFAIVRVIFGLHSGNLLHFPKHA
jgi:hypothetical protein